MIKSLQEMKNVKLKIEDQDKAIEQTNNKLDSIKTVLTSDNNNWREWANETLKKIAETDLAKREFKNLRYQSVRATAYKLLDDKVGCNVRKRVKNLKERLEKAGVIKTKIKETCLMDVIKQDRKLKEIFTIMLKGMS